MIITTTTGNENFQNSYTKSYLFRVPCHAFPMGKEMHLTYAAKDGLHNIARVGSAEVTPAAPGYRDEFGKWFRCTYEVPEDTVLMLFAMRKVSEQTAGRHQTVAVHLRMRENAPMYRVGVRLTGDRRASFSNVYTEGRFDVLTVEAATSLGVRIAPARRRQFEHIETLITTEEMSPEVAAAPVVQETTVTLPGEAPVVIRRTRRPRALDL